MPQPVVEDNPVLPVVEDIPVLFLVAADYPVLFLVVVVDKPVALFLPVLVVDKPLPQPFLAVAVVDKRHQPCFSNRMPHFYVGLAVAGIPAVAALLLMVQVVMLPAEGVADTPNFPPSL